MKLDSMKSSLLICLFISQFFIPSMAVSSVNATQDQIKQEAAVDPNENVLKKHVAFFDRNKDGLVYPKETFEGFRAIGCGLGLSTFASMAINVALSAKTRPGQPFDPLFPIVVENIALSKHTSDSGVYDTEGRFVSSKFEEIFQKHSKSTPNALTEDELEAFLKANRVPKDLKGAAAAKLEWKILYDLGKDKDGLLQKETIRAVYDGSLFEQLEQRHKD